MKYVVVIPAKNEEAHLAKTLQSIVDQTYKPEVCYVIDDGSTDKTQTIIKKFRIRYPFVRGKKIRGKGQYALGANVVDVFYSGKELIDGKDIPYDFIVKLDADVSFEPDFFQRISVKIKDGNWGIVSGTSYYFDGKKKIYQFSPSWHSNGTFKIYNKKCLQDIGGIDYSLGWDCSDNIKAMSKNWKTAAFRDLHYQIHRKIGGRFSLKKGRINHGIGACKLGYDIHYLFLRALHDALTKPFVVGSYYLLYGYFKTFFSQSVPILNKNQRNLLRKLLWQSFFERLKNGDFEVLQKISARK